MTPQSLCAYSRRSRWRLALVVVVFFVAFTLISVVAASPSLKEQARQFERFRSHISRTRPRVTTETADMEIVYPKRLANSDPAEPSLAMRVGGSLRLQRRDAVPGDEQSPVVDETAESSAAQWLGIQVYRIRAFNRDFLLTVNPRDSFLAPNFVVQHLRDNDTWVNNNGPQHQHQHHHNHHNGNSKVPPNWQRCFYSGIVNYERDSNVALSLCRGMFGIFRFKDSNYFIEPYNPKMKAGSGNSSSVHDRPHLIYKFKTASAFSVEPDANNASMPENETIGSFNWPSGGVLANGMRVNIQQVNPIDGSSSSSPLVRQHNNNNNNGRNSFHSPSSSSSSSVGMARRRRHPREQGVAGYQRHEQGAAAPRVQRSTSKNHYVELMVAADHRMRAYHGSDSALEAYILTLMAVVASVYRDPSIGNPIHILLMKVIIVHNEKDGPVMSQRAPEMLQSFCQWQHRYNDPDPLSPNHYDAAILLTRHDICRRSEKCDTLGLAEMGTICDREKSCAVVEDNGLSAAFTIIHELGHLFNLPHDSDVRCRQFPDQANGIYHVMAPTLDFNTNPWSWSTCSRKYATDFLDAEHGHCLWNIPADLELQRRLDSDYTHYPGVTYDTNFQCQLVFGRASRVCPYMPVCKRLWCTADIGESDGCRTQHMPWADGTPCGQARWCIKGECISKDQNRPQPVDGQWSSWSGYGTCSRTCGGGIKVATRTCNNPPPSNGGKFCLGERNKFKSCNTNECPPSTPDFREEQCAKYNGDNSRAERLPQSVFWIPKYDVDARSRCKLYCEAFGTGISVLMESQVIDGTKCAPDSTDICVGGVCHPAGCDNKLYSNAQYDSCGVCAGDNTTCVRVQDSFTRHMKYGYNEIVTIPRGAANIDIQQFAVNSDRGDENYLAIRSSSGEILLNGNFLVNGFRREIRVKGGVVEYSGSHNNVERLNSTARIGEELHILILSVGSLQPARVQYQWFISDKTKLHYRWRADLGEWSTCDRICQGLRYVQPRCAVENTNNVVEDHFCFGQESPTPKNELCNADCQLTWIVSRQSRCSVTCGDGVIRRQFACAKVMHGHGENETVADSNCEGVSQRPREEIPCSMPACYQEPTIDWEYSPWGECSTTCGRGYRSRKARCVNMQTGREVSMTKCDRRRKELTDESCEGPPCLAWKTSDWEECSATCGRGVRHRHVHCDSDGVPVSDENCQAVQRPASREECPSLPTCPTWLTGNWSQCSATCGLGVQTRSVWCSEGSEVVNDATCSRVASKPETERRCQGGDCPFWRVGPWSQCTKSCGPGSVRKRDIWCQTNDHVFDFDRCPPDTMPPEIEPCPLADCPAWVVSEWSRCSRTCGSGQRFRNVTCQPIEHEDKCDQKAKPDAVEECQLNDCPSWHLGDWSSCSVSCGSSGVHTRSVYCRHNGITVDEAYCLGGEGSEKPEETRQCPSMGSCPSWHMTVWGPCSTTCGPGARRRNVVCRNETVLHPPAACSSTPMPAETQPCSNGECALWSVGEWGTCSVTCANTPTGVLSYRTREVTCTLGNGVSIPPARCLSQKKPVERQNCKNLPPCIRIGYTEWSECSATCGEGVRHRRAVCFSGDEAVDMSKCTAAGNSSAVLLDSTALSESCVAKDKCPMWKAGKWTICSNACGSGEQRRDVWCEANEKAEMDHLCDMATKPAHWQMCWGELCPSWAFSEWEPCSTSCGQGAQGRQVWCQLGNSTSATEDLPFVQSGPASGDNVVNPHLCHALPRPPSFQACSAYNCPVWLATNFSECSASCGGGEQYRAVFCVLNGSIPTNLEYSPNAMNSSKILAESVNLLQIERCDPDTKPETMQACNAKSCSNWTTTAWEECVPDDPTTCGIVTGKKKRAVSCQDAVRRTKLPDESCSNAPKPVTLESCTVDLQCRVVDDGKSLTERQSGNSKRVAPSRRRLVMTTTEEPIKTSSTVEMTTKTSELSSTTAEPTSQPTQPTTPATITTAKTTQTQETQQEQQSSTFLPVSTFAWQATGWSNCSANCGISAVRQRLFSCFNTVLGQVVDSLKCDAALLAVDTIPCTDLPVCAVWIAHDWAPCSATCGRGVQTRTIICADPSLNNTAVADTRCEKRTRPKSVRYCLGSAGLCIGTNSTDSTPEKTNNIPDLANKERTAEWRVGSWGQCSATCGSGIQTRRVVCIIRRQANDRAAVGPMTAPQRCPLTARPSRTRRCQAPETCPEWQPGQWTECSVSCGIGHRRRPVICEPLFGDSGTCLAHLKPVEVETCVTPCWNEKQPLHKFEWEIGEWHKCSASCDFGVRRRRVFCVGIALSGPEQKRPVADGLCLSRFGSGAKPAAQMTCFERPCASTWLSGEWSPCSTSCGPGSQHRLVTCYSLLQQNNSTNIPQSLIPSYRAVFNPKSADKLCNPLERPERFRQCRVRAFCQTESAPANSSLSGSHIGWATGPWSKCSRTCSFGVRQRQVSCVEFLPLEKRRVLPELMCYHLNITRPESSVRCFERNCVAKSCRQAAKTYNMSQEGYYEIALSHSRLRHHRSQLTDVMQQSPLVPPSLPTVITFCRGMNKTRHISKEYLDVVDADRKPTSFRCKLNRTSSIVFQRVRFIPSAMILSFSDWSFTTTETIANISSKPDGSEEVNLELVMNGLRIGASNDKDGSVGNRHRRRNQPDDAWSSWFSFVCQFRDQSCKNSCNLVRTQKLLSRRHVPKAKPPSHPAILP